MSNSVYLTKSRYTAGLQCLRRLWLNVHEPTDWKEPESGSTVDVGLEIGRIAHLLFPGGVLVEEKPWEHAGAMARTAALMADRSVPAIFQAAFEHSRVRVRVDVLERLPRGYWGLREVKSSGQVKDHYYDDVAVQVHVLRNTGVRLSSIEILHVNKDYLRGQKEDFLVRDSFSRVDAKTEAKRRLDGINAQLKKQIACLSKSQAPKIEPDAHCHAPNSCEHWDRCTAAKPSDWVYPHAQFQRRAARGIEGPRGGNRYRRFRTNFVCHRVRQIIRDVTRNSRLFVASDLSERLDGFGPPAFYLDFEAFLPAVPLYPGTRPYQTIPFQWSLHQVDSKGNVSHQEFLADERSGPAAQICRNADRCSQGREVADYRLFVLRADAAQRNSPLLFPDLERPIAAISRATIGPAARRAGRTLSSGLWVQQLDQERGAGSLPGCHLRRSG